jgi:hypothetical protein
MNKIYFKNNTLAKYYKIENVLPYRGLWNIPDEFIRDNDIELLSYIELKSARGYRMRGRYVYAVIGIYDFVRDHFDLHTSRANQQPYDIQVGNRRFIHRCRIKYELGQITITASTEVSAFRTDHAVDPAVTHIFKVPLALPAARLERITPLVNESLQAFDNAIPDQHKFGGNQLNIVQV